MEIFPAEYKSIAQLPLTRAYDRYGRESTTLPVRRGCGQHLNSPRPQPGLRRFGLVETTPDVWPTEIPAAGFTSTILLVEDEEAIRQVATLYLQASGYRVFEASGGAQAIALWNKHACEIDLVLTDLVMPGGVNGHQLVQQLQADRPDLKAIFVSGYSSELFSEQTCLDETAKFLQKPYRLKDLVEMIHECVQEPSGGAPMYPSSSSARSRQN